MCRPLSRKAHHLASNAQLVNTQVMEGRHRKHIAAILKQAETKTSAASSHACSSRELFTLDWANKLLEATWVPALEQVLSARLATNLEVGSDRPGILWCLITACHASCCCRVDWKSKVVHPIWPARVYNHQPPAIMCSKSLSRQNTAL